MDAGPPDVCWDGMMQRWSALSATARDAVVVGGWFLFGTLLYLAGFHMLFVSDATPPVPIPVRLLVLALACAVLFIRRRAPVAAMLAGLLPLALDLSLGPTLPVWLVYTDLIYAAVVYGTRRQMQGAVVAWLTLSAIVAGVALALTGSWRVMVLALVLAAAFVGTSLWWGLTVRAHKETAEAERARGRALSLVAELDRRAAVADERKAMARDLHDVIAGHLSAIALQSEAALAGIEGAGTDPRLTGILTSIRANSVDALQEMRTMIGLLRRDDDDPEDAAAPGRLAQLSRLVTAARQAGVRVRCHQDTGTGAPPGAIDQAAYRIIQEAVTNAMKHAPGQEIEIEVTTEGGELVLAVRNPLPAVPSVSDAGPAVPRGLTNMGERAAALGGTFRAGPDGGIWWVRARLPLTAVTAGEGR
ncbi:sensor histidine kinase [Nocardia sp. NPDC003345]